MNPPVNPRRALPVVLLTVFLDLLGVGILIPVIPQLFANPHSAEYLLSPTTTLRTGYIILGLLSGLYPLMLFLAAPILGQLSDRYGRRPLLAFSIFGTAFSYLVFALGLYLRNIPILFLARALDGLTAGNIAIAQAIIADVTPPQDRAKNFGLIGAAFGVGFVVGPFLGGVLADPTVVSWFSSAIPFLFAAILSVINGILVLTLIPETRGILDATRRIQWTKSVSNILRAARLPELRTVFVTNFFFQAGFTFFTTFFAVHLVTRFGFNQSSVGNFFAYVGIWIAFTQAVVTRAVSRRIPEAKVLPISMIACGVILLLLPVPNVLWMLLVLIPFFALATGLTQANTTALVSRRAGPEVQGEVLGINSSVQGLAMSIAPILSGFIAATTGPSDPILMGGLLVLAAGFFFLFS